MNWRSASFFMVTGSIIAIIASFAIGLLGKFGHVEIVENSLIYCKIFGRLWIILLLIVAIPMTCAYMVLGILSILNGREASSLGLRGLGAQFGLMLLGIIWSVSCAWVFLEFWGTSIPSLANTESVTSFPEQSAAETLFTLNDISNYLGTFQKALGSYFLLFIFITIVISVIILIILPQRKKVIQRVSGKLANRSLQYMLKYMISLPFAVFALILPVAFESGLNTVGFVVYYLVSFCLLLIIFLVILHFIVHFFGHLNFFSFLKSMMPAHLMAISTRSSLVTIPAMIECAEHGMKIPNKITALFIPFLTSYLKVNHAVTGAFQVMVLAYVFDVPINWTILAIFILSHNLKSLASPGIPTGSVYTSLPLFVAAGIPAEGYLLIRAIDTIPDFFQTMVNVTSVMTVTSIVTKQNEQKEGKIVRV